MKFLRVSPQIRGILEVSFSLHYQKTGFFSGKNISELLTANPNLASSSGVKDTSNPSKMTA